LRTARRSNLRALADAVAFAAEEEVELAFDSDDEEEFELSYNRHC
jgi:hypothetical protein